ncbi:hypothetical protein CMV_002764 [Castanea mollissima]|uniref:Uncharacterized protein n=1 Tax=Castanea mollissima TaxID=60419 RepID=A0A8J4S0X2_9ROSI|nr:hypothetical protein CMV_002764 [Castanea mollissima]
MGGFRPAWVASARRGPCVVVGHGWLLMVAVLVASRGSGFDRCLRSRLEWVASDRHGTMANLLPIRSFRRH